MFALSCLYLCLLFGCFMACGLTKEKEEFNITKLLDTQTVWSMLFYLSTTSQFFLLKSTTILHSKLQHIAHCEHFWFQKWPFKYLKNSRVVYDRLRKRKNCFEITAWLTGSNNGNIFLYFLPTVFEVFDDFSKWRVSNMQQKWKWKNHQI